ncbi:MAG: hypothetical protein ACI4OT_03705 [Bacilli bacterium]
MNNENKQITKRNKIIKVTALLGLFLLVFGVSYALFSVVLEGTKKNKITTGTLSLKITDIEGNEETEGYGINLDNAVPISAEEALNTVEPYEFIIENNGSIDAEYELYIETSDDTTLSASAIKYYLTRIDLTATAEVLSMSNMDSSKEAIEPTKEDETLGNLESFNITRILERVKTTKEAKTVYKLDMGTIPSKQKYKYSLKMWVAYAADNNAMDKTFEGKLKIYGNQTTKDSAYVVEKVDLTSYCDYLSTIPGYKIYAKRYSDNSIRFQGFGDLTNEMRNDIEYQKLLSNSIFTSQFLNDINTELAKDGIDPYDNFLTFIIDWENLTLSSDVETAINNIVDNAESYHQDYDVYIEDGIVRIPSQFGGDPTRLYISTTVHEIGMDAFRGNNYLTEVEFTENKEPMFNSLVSTGLTVYDGAFMQCPSLTKVHFLNNLKVLGKTSTSNNGSPFKYDTNAIIEIEAKKADVSFQESYAFKDVKEVKWLNG